LLGAEWIDGTWFHPAGDDYLQQALASDEAFEAAVEIEQRTARATRKFQEALRENATYRQGRHDPLLGEARSRRID
jgi:hypothetical protein